jgi:hypothetical protein
VHGHLSSVSFDSIVFLRFSPPFSLFLCLYHRSAVTMLRAVFRPILTYAFIESGAVYLVLLESNDVFVQPLPSLDVYRLVVNVGIREIGSVELKVRRVVYQQFLWSRSTVARFFSHSLPSFYYYIGKRYLLLYLVLAATTLNVRINRAQDQKGSCENPDGFHNWQLF